MLGTKTADFNTDDETVANVMRIYLWQVEDVFTATLVRAQATGEIRFDANPHDLSRLLLCATQGIALLGRVMDNDITLEGAVTAAIFLLDHS